VPVEVVCFDVGYTLIDETRSWLAWADRLSVTPDRLFAALRESIELGETRSGLRALERLRPDLDLASERTALFGGPSASSFRVEDVYADAQPTLVQLRAMGFRVGAAGNMRADTESVLVRSRLPLDFVGSSERWGVDKPNRRFFDHVVTAGGVNPDRIAYVGDRLDNDMMPAKRAGMLAVFVRRGPWGEVHARSPDVAIVDATIATLTELLPVATRWRSTQEQTRPC
jgi:FMN phosphatase YigB (HAD superfamily)